MVQRIRRVRLGIGRFFCAVENVIRAVVDQPDVFIRAQFRQRCRAGGVDRPRKIALDFTAVHLIVGGGVDDNLRLPGRQPLRHQILLGQIKLRVAGKGKLKIARRDFFELIRQQPIAAGDENAFHPGKV